jgi:hypothetical protein
MTAYVDECDDCGRCGGCNRRWCPNEEPSPGEAAGLCPDCWLTEDPMEGE